MPKKKKAKEAEPVKEEPTVEDVESMTLRQQVAYLQSVIEQVVDKTEDLENLISDLSDTANEANSKSLENESTIEDLAGDADDLESRMTEFENYSIEDIEHRLSVLEGRVDDIDAEIG